MNKVLEDYYKIRKQHDEALAKVDKEVIRIVKIIANVFKIKKYWWSYQYYDGDNVDPPLPEFISNSDEYFPIHISGVEADSGKTYYNEEFPVSFFDMTDQQIADYIQKEIKEVETEEKIEKEEQEQKKKETLEKLKKLKKTAAKKLSKEEREALGL